ncbi:uncharacterized protein LOC144166593 [Haemaphysalis longicornis]
MAEGRRSSRSVKVINYAKLEVGSDEDDDFKSGEAPPSKRTKPSSTKEAPKKPEKKSKDDRKGAASSNSTDQKEKAGRASLDDKLFQRDLEAALRLSQNGQPPALQAENCSILHQKNGNLGDTPGVQNDGAMFPEGLELAGEEVVQSEEVGARPVPPAAPEEEDYRPDEDGESSASEEDEEDDASDDDFGGGSDDDDEEFAPTKAKATRPRKQPAAPPKKPAASAPKKEPGSARGAVTKKTPSVMPQAAAAKSVVPPKPQAPINSVRPPSAPSQVTKSMPVAPRHSATAAKSSSPSAAVSRPLAQRTAPAGGVPMTVPKFSTGQLPASGIRLGLSRRRFGKPLHSVVKVLQ